LVVFFRGNVDFGVDTSAGAGGLAGGVEILSLDFSPNLGDGGGTGDLSWLFSLNEGVRDRAGGLGRPLGDSSSDVESDPPPKLFAFLSLIVTVSDAVSDEFPEELLVSLSISVRSVVFLRLRRGVSEGRDRLSEEGLLGSSRNLLSLLLASDEIDE